MDSLERNGSKDVKEDMKTHVYKLEDKGSCITRIKKEDYENNVKEHLNNSGMYKKLSTDPTKETEEVVLKHIEKMVD